MQPAIAARPCICPFANDAPLQYENLTATDSQVGVLSDLQRFLGLDPHRAPSALLPEANTAPSALKRTGWPMKQQQYQALVDAVRPDAQR